MTQFQVKVLRRREEALAGYGALVKGVIGNRDALIGMSNLIQPYFDLLTADGASTPQGLSDLFLASQLVERPGAADTLAQLARQFPFAAAKKLSSFAQLRSSSEKNLPSKSTSTTPYLRKTAGSCQTQNLLLQAPQEKHLQRKRVAVAERVKLIQTTAHANHLRGSKSN